MSITGFGFDDEDDDDEDKLTITHGTGDDSDGDDSEFDVDLPDEEDDRPEVEQLVDPVEDEVTLFEVDTTEQSGVGEEIAEAWITVDENDVLDITEVR